MDSISETMDEVNARWKERVVADLDEFRQSHLEILKMASSQQDETLIDLAGKLSAAIQNLSATVSQRLNQDARDRPDPGWKGRVIADLHEISRIKVNLLLLAAARENTELAAITNKLHLIRCSLSDTITLRFLVNGVVETLGKERREVLSALLDDCADAGDREQEA